MFLKRALLIALAATTVSTVTLGYLYKEAIQDVARVRAEAQVEALAAANDAAARAALSIDAAARAREAQLLARIAAADAAAVASADRAQAATESLRNFATEQQRDVASADWQATPLPDSVTQRLRELVNAN